LQTDPTFTLYGTGLLNGVAEQQYLLGDGGFTGIRVTYYREGTAFAHLGGLSAHMIWLDLEKLRAL